jgi:outer membrane lipoprotein-sorting protein
MPTSFLARFGAGLALATALSSGLVAAAPAPDAQAILAASDAVRNPSKPFSITVSLTEYTSGKQSDASTLQVYSREDASSGQFRCLMRISLPARDANKLMLKSGNDLWFFDPASKASVRISPQQRLLGQAANGDVVTVNLAQGYKARLEQEEDVQDGDRKTRPAYKLALTAAVADATYHSVEMWVDKADNRPLKARFFSESQRLLKTAYYRRYREEMGAVRPTEVVIIDGINPNLVTVMRYDEFTPRNIPESWFQREFLPRFQPE